ncbi:MAG: hypothetical protein HW394_222 [Acidobacteria bacterium]|nr:hypothetical protein [Acidobacteriota bacterium]
MSHTFQCGENTALVSYLYDECEPAERAAIDAHVPRCAACAAELAALESARVQLASWTPPEADLGFQVVRPQGLGPRAWLRQPLPMWAQAAAACLIFAAGLWLGVARGLGVVPGLGVARGSMPSGSPAVATTGAAPAAAPTAASPAELAALERRLRAEMTELRTVAANASTAAPQRMSEARLLARVRALLEESEQRQQRELALRTAQVVRDFDSQRRVDLAQIQRSFGQIEGLTGAEVREQRQMLNYLMRVSEQR